MNDNRREILIGYLMGVLEPQETARVDAELQTSEVLRSDLAAIYREIAPIHEIADVHEPPLGLATRTCRNLWAKIDSAQDISAVGTSTATLAFPPNSRRKRKITVVVSPDGSLPEEDASCPLPTASNLAQDVETGTVIPLSRALQHAASSKPRNPNRILRRVDQAEDSTPETHLILADSMIIAKRHPPKHYGREKEKKTEKIKTPWATRDIVASLLVGLTAAVLIFPLIQIGIGGFREMIIQKKVEDFAKTVAPNTSHGSLHGFSQNDIRAFASMNLDPQSASMPLSPQNTMTSPSPDTPIVPVGLSSRYSDVANLP